MGPGILLLMLSFNEKASDGSMTLGTLHEDIMDMRALLIE